jgi:hypothetical protein
VLLPLLLKGLPRLQEFRFYQLHALPQLSKLKVLIFGFGIHKRILILEPLVFKLEHVDQPIHLLFLCEAGSRLIQGLVHVRCQMRVVTLQVDLVSVRIPLEWLGVSC